MDRLYHAYDCKDTLIFFDQYALNDKKKCLKISNEQYTKATKCLTEPTLIIDSDNCLTCYYYHAISLEKFYCRSTFYLRHMEG
jgi:hypothetical protein